MLLRAPSRSGNWSSMELYAVMIQLQLILTMHNEAVISGLMVYTAHDCYWYIVDHCWVPLYNACDLFSLIGSCKTKKLYTCITSHECHKTTIYGELNTCAWIQLVFQNPAYKIIANIS